MAPRYTETFKIEAVKRYGDGESIKSLCQDLGIAESTLYRWIQTHKSHQSSEGEFTPKSYEKLAKSADSHKILSKS